MLSYILYLTPCTYMDNHAGFSYSSLYPVKQPDPAYVLFSFLKLTRSFSSRPLRPAVTSPQSVNPVKILTQKAPGRPLERSHLYSLSAQVLPLIAIFAQLGRLICYIAAGFYRKKCWLRKLLMQQPRVGILRKQHVRISCLNIRKK